jgi:glycosyltransferase involved in cell wall biosynthesis
VTKVTRDQRFPGRLAIQQRVLPSYRSLFFSRLATGCAGGLGLLAGQPRPSEAILPGHPPAGVRFQSTRNVHLLWGPAYLCLQPGLISWLEAEDPDVLVLEANPRYLSNRTAIEWMHARRRPVIGWGLGSPIRRGLLADTRRSWRQRHLGSFDGMLAYSRRGAQEYQRLGLDPGSIYVVPNAVAPTPDRQPARSGDSAGPLTVLFVGRLQARKRVCDLIRACAATEPSPTLLIVGEGPDRRRAEALAARLETPVRFTGALEGTALHEMYRQADLFVLPGTGGLAIQEAMAHGLPVIAAEGDGTQQDMVTPENGWLIQPGDQADLLEKLRQAVADRRRLANMGVVSYRMARDSFNIDVMARSFIRAISRIAAEAR